MLAITFHDTAENKTAAKTKPGAKGRAEADSWIVTVDESLKLHGQAQICDEQLQGGLEAAMKAARFKGKKGQTATLLAPSGLPVARLIALGTGKDEKFDLLAAQSLGAGLIGALNAYGAKTARIFCDGDIFTKEHAAALAQGAQLKSYRFDKYHTKLKPEEKPTFETLEILTPFAREAQKLHDPQEKINESVFFIRDLVSEPANVIYPESMAEKCRELEALGVKVEVLGEKEMKKLGMGALLGVGQGSERESKLVVMEWKGIESKAPLAFVGKGVTFDTGGISIKPAGGMEEMKWDMGGAATVIGLLRALAARKAKVHAVGVVGLVENMPDGNAQRPGDVVKSMSGQTIEVLNTDAEGRLVLADALWYTQEKFSPRLVIDLATLTGAIIVALGTSRAGLFSNDDALAEQLAQAGKITGEEVWRLPLGEVYDKQINSSIADMQNIGKEREAGSITAAQFLKRFIKDEKTPWAHLDIAGVAWTSKGIDTAPKGATGYGVRLLNQLIRDHYEA
jgi:leucyl aminopeptidase